MFAALADPTRREVLRILASRELPVKEIAEQFPVTRSAISQHLGILRSAGLVESRKAGRTRYYRARAEGLAGVIDWLAHFDVFWSAKLKALEEHLRDQ